MVMTTDIEAANRLTGHPLAVDALYVATHRRDFIGKSPNLAWVAADRGMRLNPSPGTNRGDEQRSGRRALYRGTYTSPPIVADFAFNEVVPSWAVRLDEEKQGYRVQMRFAGENGQWSPWFHFGGAGILARNPGTRRTIERNDWGRVEIDYIILRKPARRFQYRVELLSTVPPVRDRRMVLQRFAVSYSNTLGDEALFRRVQNSKKPVSDAWMRVLPIPYRSQLWVEDKELAGQICCPTCVAMVLASHGLDMPTTDVASMAYDEENKIYGNWSRAAQIGTRYGLEGTVQRFRSDEDVKRAIAEGLPVIASIRFRRGELRNAHYQNTGGHLILIRGFTQEGDYVVNDPYNPGPDGEEVVYLKDDMQKVWFDKGGVGIVYRPAVANSQTGWDPK
jgi:hypothetical protein